MAALRHVLCMLLLAFLVACAAPPPQGGAGVEPAPSRQEGGTPPSEVKAPPMSKPLPPERVVTAPVSIDRSCDSDADCQVKNVGNCCGYFPACVNKDSPTDPAAVQAECQAKGVASVCGFREISACTCNAGTCESAGSGAVPQVQ